MRNERELQKRKTGNFKLKMTAAVLILAALSIAEVYLMLNYPTEYLYLGAVGLVILCCVYWLVDISFQMQKEDDVLHGKEYESLYKAEKVSYISMKQGFLDIESMLKKMEDLPVDDVIQSQKAIGKVTIQRNKEGMQAVLEAQNELKERMDALERKLDGISGIAERQQEILDAVQRMGDFAAGSISVAADPAAVQNTQKTQEAPDSNEMMAEEQIVADAVSESSSEAAAEDAATDITVSVDEEDAVAGGLSEASDGAMMTDEEIARLLSAQDESDGDEVSSADTGEAAEEPQAGLSGGVMMTDEEIAKLLSEQDGAIEDAATDVTVSVDEENAVSGSSSGASDGAMMTEEEIARLLSGQDGTAGEEAAGAAAESVVAETSVEEKPDMPDLSDPGHVMTPEEIAALLANM